MSERADCVNEWDIFNLRRYPLQKVVLTGPTTRRVITVAHIEMPRGKLRADIVTGSLYDTRGQCLTGALRIRPLRKSELEKSK